MDQPSVFVLFVLLAVPAFYFFLEFRTGWRLWSFLPPLLWIYATPLVLRALGILPEESPVYAGIRMYLLPVFITLLVMTIDLRRVVATLGSGLPVLLVSTACVIVGAPIGYLALSAWLPPGTWTGYGALAGSWIGGTANMAAMERALGTPPDQMGLAILADQLVFLLWLPLLIVSARYAGPFNRWVKAKPLVLDETEAVGGAGPEAAGEPEGEAAADPAPAIPVKTYLEVPPMLDLLLMLTAALANVALCAWIAAQLPELPPFITGSTWLVLLVTTGAVLLSFTPIRRSYQAEVTGTAVLYIFVANMGASASVAGFAEAPAFVAGAFVWLFVSASLMVLAAKLMRTDLRLMAVAAIANVGGAASAPVVAAAHHRSLVPVAILMAMLCYAIGNYGAIVAGHLVRIVAGA
ncbi:DUF819 family protein [Sphingomonas sp.]|uniref:DUF819 family protein n=1 Tax=Sphingomonas sp. TaxID=28214 RepID=UPI0018482A63|nr:DUF819 family protein [Sphingomonas sp.]MBA3510325.1 DUF819 family protein [Sphingomonas sp.]